eukprot:m.232598 g.232598  ORF g.232598 m.232598 type:complete len:780 (-) comp33624_c0_seq1:74-2413(-)
MARIAYPILKRFGLVLLLVAGCSGDHERDFFDWMFATSPTQTNGGDLFRQIFFHKEPYYVSRSFGRSYYKAHFPIGQLWPQFTHNRNRITLRFDGRRLRDIKSASILGDMFSGNFHHVIETLPNKFSLVLRYEWLSEQFAPINWLSDKLLEQHEEVQSVHGYYSAPGGAKALQAHTDPYDVLILQINGSKRWTICLPQAISNQTSSAERANKFAKDHANGQSCVTYTQDYLASNHACFNYSMQVGDLLYLPRNVIHFAETIDESSLHLTIGLKGEENTAPNSFREESDCDEADNTDGNNGNGFFSDIVQRKRRTCSALSGGYFCETSCDLECDSSCQGVGAARSCDAACKADCDDGCVEGCHVNYNTLTTAACVTRITSQADCSYAAQVLSKSDTSASSVYVSNRPRGCYMTLGSLYFNSFSSTVACDINHQCVCVGDGGTTVATTVAAKPFFELSVGSCGCAVQSRTNCSEAATTLGYTFTTTNDTFSTEYPRGCSFRPGVRGELVYNHNTTSTATCSATNTCICHRSGSDECTDGNDGGGGDTNEERLQLTLEAMIAMVLAGAMCCFIVCALVCYNVCCGRDHDSRRIVPFVQNPAIEATLNPHEIMRARRVHSQSILTSTTPEESNEHDVDGFYDNTTTATIAIGHNVGDVGDVGDIGGGLDPQRIGHDYTAASIDEPYYATIESDPVYIEPLLVPGDDRSTSPEYATVERTSPSSGTDSPTSGDFAASNENEEAERATAMLMPQEGTTIDEEDHAASTTADMPTNQTDAYTLEPI